ncbi:MAG TPA: alpha/beta hydrolase [Rugosimonospora sp.]|nr:alpha/beta hydrolase [Rugosimonospora sp.]
MEQDILGEPYERHTIELGTDDEGPVVATLVRRRAGGPTRRAVLYVHGYNDYFFQSHLADWYVDRGFDFYALDLRKYGRSLLPHQTPNFIHRISDYFPELDEAARIVREQDGHDTLLVNAHSTGGLITSLWTHQVRDAGVVDGLFLNSPFFEFNVPRLTRGTVGPLFGAITRFRPYAKVPSGVSTVYGHSIHADHRGEWSFDTAWKPIIGFTPRAGWLNAIRTAQARLHAGLNIPVPVLVACSMRSYKRAVWSDDARSADSVLDVEHIARWAPALGQHVTIVRIEGGLHDLALSAPPVRERVFAELDRWLGAYLPAG